MATTAAVGEFRRVLSDPSGNKHYTLSDRALLNLFYWSYYSNDMYQDWEQELADPNSQWQKYRAHYELYRFIRSLINPVRRIVEFYVGSTYPPPELVETGITEVDEITLAFPLDDKTPLSIQRALAQGMQWANWLENLPLTVRFGAALGNCLVEIVDDRERRKCYPRVYWPGHVSDLKLDSTGNVKEYMLSFPARDEQGVQYTYGKRVNKETIRTYKNGELFDYTGVQAERLPGSTPGEVPNPYGFVPATWRRFFNTGEDFGQPIFWTSIGKIDELNMLVSMVHDRLALLLQSDLFAKGDTDLSALDADADDAAPSPVTPDRRDREKIGITEVGSDFALEALPIEVSQAEPRIAGLYAELRAEHRELEVYSHESNSPESGYAISLKLGDVEAQVYATQRRFDQQEVKTWQMFLSMCGYCIHSGAWGLPSEWTAQQRLYYPFYLESYSKSEINFSIPTRKFMPPTELEAWDARQKRADALTAEQALIDVASERILVELDISELDIKAILAEREKQATEQAAARASELQAMRDAQFAPNGVGTTDGEQADDNDEQEPVSAA